jgi:hypothetical protein
MKTLEGLRLFITTFAAFFAISMVTTVYAAQGLLDGKTFVGETGEKGTTKGDKEDFVFANGMFDPLACHKYGFSITTYTAQAEGDAVTFVADHSNKKGDRMRWEGTVKGEKLDGIMTYWQGKKAPREYWFKGALLRQ